jgi:cytochrome P450
MSGDAAVEPPMHTRRRGFLPAPELGALRIRRVATRFPLDAWLVTGNDDVRAVLGDADAFRNGLGTFQGSLAGVETPDEYAARRVGSLLFHDPPSHTRLRRMLAPEFSARRVERLRARVTEIVDDHLDRIEAAGPPADLVADYALPVPSLVVCALLGVPPGERAAFQHRTRVLLDVGASAAEKDRVQWELRDSLAELVERAFREQADDLPGRLAAAGEVSRAELVGIAVLLLVAGHETTASVLGLGTLALLRDPEQLELVRDNGEAVAPAVEEILRWVSVVHTAVARTATRDVEVGGRTVAAGEVVLCSLAAADHDPAVLPDPDRLDLTRGRPGHLAFGHGIHHCLGAPLARLELQIALPALLRRLPALAELPGAAFRPAGAVFGLQALPVTW